MPHSSSRQNAYRRDTNPYPSIEVRALPPELSAAAWALWSEYESLDLQLRGNLFEAEAELLASLPVIEGHENDLRRLVKILVEDARQRPDITPDGYYQFRFLSNVEELNGVLPQSKVSRITVIPVTEEYSYHADASPDSSNDIAAQIDALEDQHFTFITAASAEAEQDNPDDEFINLRQPLTKEQMLKYRLIARMVAQALADSVNQGMDAQAGLAGAMNAIRGAAIRLLSNISAYQKNLEKHPSTESVATKSITARTPAQEAARAVRFSAVDLEKTIKGQMGNSGLSAVMHQTLRSGLQQLQQIKADSGIAPRVHITLKPRLAGKLSVASPSVKAPTSSPRSTVALAEKATSHKAATLVKATAASTALRTEAAKPISTTHKNAARPAITRPIPTATKPTAIIIDFKQAAAQIQRKRIAASPAIQPAQQPRSDAPQSLQSLRLDQPRTEAKSHQPSPDIKTPPSPPNAAPVSKSQTSSPIVENAAKPQIAETRSNALPETKIAAAPTQQTQKTVRSDTKAPEVKQTATDTLRSQTISITPDAGTHQPKTTAPTVSQPQEPPRTEAVRETSIIREAVIPAAPKVEATTEIQSSDAPQTRNATENGQNVPAVKASTTKAEQQPQSAHTAETTSPSVLPQQAPEQDADILKKMKAAGVKTVCPVSGQEGCGCGTTSNNTETLKTADSSTKKQAAGLAARKKGLSPSNG